MKTRVPKIRRTTMRLSNETMRLLSVEARKRGLSRTTLTELLLRDYLRKSKDGADGESVFG